MEVYEAIRLRKAVRSYQDRPVEKDKLERVLNGARLAPSAHNMQEWRFVVVSDRATREALRQTANNQAFVAEAPLVIACCAAKSDHVMRCGQPSYAIDVALATDHLSLAAVAEPSEDLPIGDVVAMSAEKSPVPEPVRAETKA